jgi:hypothetical protein
MSRQKRVHPTWPNFSRFHGDPGRPSDYSEARIAQLAPRRGTLMQKYLREQQSAVQEPKLSINYYLKSEDAEGLQFKEELAKILKGS